MKRGAGAVDGVEKFVMCGEFALEGLVVVSLEMDVSTFVDACVSGMQFSEKVGFIDELVEEIKP